MKCELRKMVNFYTVFGRGRSKKVTKRYLLLKNEALANYAFGAIIS
jgi:hypothetical protein